jgi:hypothetical protein
MELGLIKLPKIVDERGNLTFLQAGLQVPFEIKRAFWIYDVPGGEMRGGHAFKEQNEIIIALSGSFDVTVKDKNGVEHKYSLNRSYTALFIPNLSWRHLDNFSTNAVALHLVDMEYTSTDYIRDANQFDTLCKKR